MPLPVKAMAVARLVPFLMGRFYWEAIQCLVQGVTRIELNWV